MSGNVIALEAMINSRKNQTSNLHPFFFFFFQDAQEFLRCFMDQLHEELKYASVADDDDDEDDEDDMNSTGTASQPRSGVRPVSAL